MIATDIGKIDTSDSVALDALRAKLSLAKDDLAFANKAFMRMPNASNYMLVQQYMLDVQSAYNAMSDYAENMRERSRNR